MDLRDPGRESARDRVVRFLSHIGRNGGSGRSSYASSFRGGVHEDSQGCDSERRRMKVCEKSVEKENALVLENRADGLIRKAERFFVANRKNLFYVHAAMVVVFLVLIVAPAFLPAPSESDGLSSNFVLFSKFMVWGLWFPLVFISVIFLGRFWCGTLCPQGALTEYANKKTLNKPVPRLLASGWVPVSSFIIVTIAGQVVGVRDYPLAALELFGITTLAAVLTGFIFARER